MPAAESNYIKYCIGFILTKEYYKLIVCKTPNNPNLYFCIALWDVNGADNNKMYWYKFVGTALS